MLVDKTIFTIFRQGSTTYFYSSLFFPTKIRKNVFILYAFVRQADNFVDQIPQDRTGFYNFKHRFEEAWNGKQTDDIVIDSFVLLAKEKNFEKSWIDAFLDSMEMDLTKRVYQTMDDTLEYIYGSAEIIGLFMARILGLVDRSFESAKYLGRSMQYINFIRDIDEDTSLGRLYFPQTELARYGLESLDHEYVKRHPDQFNSFMNGQIERYCGWQELAEHGYDFIPKRYLIPIKTASEMYKWTAHQIAHDPFIIYRWKVKPMISQIITETFKSMVDIVSKKDQIHKCEEHLTQ
ncbi:MAG TPA: phytoene/squalene synthase family protein [Candidatus Thermoplasmatota archaeon]|nr:phytoene/squalene synthase family protein [Candidatus Thermoplasmatota archaeon]